MRINIVINPCPPMPNNGNPGIVPPWLQYPQAPIVKPTPMPPRPIGCFDKGLTS